jgi:hypothetical protein
MKAGYPTGVEQLLCVRMVGVDLATLPPRLFNLGLRPREDGAALRVVPKDDLVDHSKQPAPALSPCGLEVIWRETAGIFDFPPPRGVVHELGKEDPAHRRKGSLSPPLV